MSMHKGHVSDRQHVEREAGVFHGGPGRVRHEVGMCEETIWVVEVAASVCLFWTLGGASVQVVGLVGLELARIAGEIACECLALEGQTGGVVGVQCRSVGELSVGVRWGRGS